MFKKLLIGLSLVFGTLTSGCVRHVPSPPITCRVSPFPKAPEPTFLLPCHLDEEERVCTDKEFLDRLRMFHAQVKRWRDEVRACVTIKEDTRTTAGQPYEHTMYKIMASF